MTYNVEINKEDGILLVKITGIWNDETGPKVVEEVISECKNCGYEKVLIDTSKYSVEPGRAIDLIDLHSTLKDIPLEDLVNIPKTALVVAVNEYECYKLVETTVKNRGLDTMVFTDNEDAEDWLNKE